MAKTIKFNLICDDNPIRTLEDLRNNFSIEDILAYYENKLLHRWLEVRGYTEELKKVAAISSEQPLQIIKELIKIFQVIADEAKIEESVYMLEYLEERKELCSLYEKENTKIKAMITDYETGYRELVRGLLDNPNNVAKIKAALSEIVLNYKWIVELDYRRLFYILMKKSTLAVMCLLMNEDLRGYYLPTAQKHNEDGTIIWDMCFDEDRQDMFGKICRMIETKQFRIGLGDHLKSFAGVTDGYWKDLEPKGKKYMIIRMGEGDFVRSAGESGGDLSREAVKDKFVILDGIDYKSNSTTRALFYMEV